MATGKRASMREGPLAALFRKTAEEGGETSDDRALPPGADPEERRALPAPHPSLEASADAPLEEAERPNIPTPQERLRHAFSSDIPENVLEPPAGPAPPRDVYAR